MAGITGISDAKSGRAIVTGATGLSALHRLHGQPLPVGTLPSNKKCRMTLIATVHLDMCRVRKNHIANLRIPVTNVAGMAFGAISLNGKGPFAIVASTARLAALHGLHADMVTVIFLNENLGMTCITVRSMKTVSENNLAHSLGLNLNLVHHPSHPPHIDRPEAGR